MAAHTWPAGLPCFLVAGYARGGGEDGVLRSDFPGGTKSRPQFTRPPPEPVTASMVCDAAQLQTVLDFWAITTRRTLPFNHIDPTKPDGLPVEYQFRGRPRYVPHRTGRRWLVTMELWQLTSYQGTFPLGDGGGALLTDAPSGNTLTT